jgi:hypothetical protein
MLEKTLGLSQTLIEKKIMQAAFCGQSQPPTSFNSWPLVIQIW